MITDEIIKQLKIIIEELEVLDEFLIQFARDEEEEEDEEEDEEGIEEDPKDRKKVGKIRLSLTDILKAKME